jgi:hypothetical protein
MIKRAPSGAPFFFRKVNFNMEKGERRKIPDRELKLLFGLAAMRCAICRKSLYIKGRERGGALFGKIAHIEAHSDNGPRANPKLSVEDRNRYQNLLLVCGNHHDEIDQMPDQYPVTRLREIKAQHEDWVRQSLSDSIESLSFVELEQVASTIASTDPGESDGFATIPPMEKIAKNELSPRVTNLLRIGLMRGKEVQQFVEDVATTDRHFPGRLVGGFAAEYRSRRSGGLKGDSLFLSLLEFAGSGSSDFMRQTAGLAVLSHLFTTCDLFEK